MWQYILTVDSPLLERTAQIRVSSLMSIIFICHQRISAANHIFLLTFKFNYSIIPIIQTDFSFSLQPNKSNLKKKKNTFPEKNGFVFSVELSLISLFPNT